MDVQVSKTGQVVVARLLARWLDAQTSSQLRRVVGEEIDKGERFVVLDMSEVENADSAGLGALIRVLKLVPEGGRLVLSGCRPPLQLLLDRARLSQILVSYPTAAEAIASFGG